MKQGLGSVFLYNIIIVFIILIFAFLSAAISYSKAFRVNSRIINAIEKYEGYNNAASSEIDKNLTVIGYRTGKKSDCPSRNGASKVYTAIDNHKYCVYRFDTDAKHYTYGVLTYMDFELPFNFSFSIPVYSKTNKIYRFGVK